MILIAIMATSLCSGCVASLSGKQVCLDFLSRISEGDYAGAYELLDDNI